MGVVYAPEMNLAYEVEDAFALQFCPLLWSSVGEPLSETVLSENLYILFVF